LRSESAVSYDQPVMTRTVQCIKLGRELPGLKSPPYPGELGQRIFENVSQEGWRQWLAHQTMLINEYRLTPIEPKAREFLVKEMEKFFFGEGSDKPKEFVPPTD
jgi:Fe-S cluster biosynthesis and repair protein YggX